MEEKEDFTKEAVPEIFSKMKKVSIQTKKAESPAKKMGESVTPAYRNAYISSAKAGTEMFMAPRSFLARN